MNGLGLVKGLLLTFKHFFATYLVDITGGKQSKARRGQINADGLFTIQFPEESVTTSKTPGRVGPDGILDKNGSA